MRPRLVDKGQPRFEGSEGDAGSEPRSDHGARARPGVGLMPSGAGIRSKEVERLHRHQHNVRIVGVLSAVQAPLVDEGSGQTSMPSMRPSETAKR